MEHLLRVEAMKTGGTIRRPEGDDKENEPSKRLRRSRRQQQKEDATTKKAKARHSGRDKRSGLRPGDGRRNSTERSAGAVGGDEKKARRAKTKDGEPSTKSSSKARSSSAPSSLRRGCIIIANQCSIKVTYLCMNAHPVSVVFR